MVLRSGIILPFQFRDTKKLLMIGVAEENRNLSIWDLKNVVRAAFGVYNFEFRNKKIGFNIPDELLLHYLAQRHDLTNFVIEIGQAYEPCKDNYYTCRCGHADALAPKPLDLHDNSTNLANHHAAAATAAMTTTLPPRISHSATNSSLDEPPLKMRMTEPTTLTAAPPPPPSSSEISHIECEPKIDYDAITSVGGSAIDATDDTMNDHDDDADINDDDEPVDHLDNNENNHIVDSHHVIAQHQIHNMAKSFVDDVEHQRHEMHFERLQHELFLQQQQQQQHHQQQQQQHQQQQQQQQQQHHLPHMDVLMQETATNSLRQRKERMSKKQKEVYVNFLEQYPLINEHRRNEPLLDRYWIKLADILNSVPQGAVKHVAEWKQTFDNWRYRVFLYARYNSKINGEDALNPKSFKPLTHTDKRAYTIWIRNPDTAPPDLDKMRNVFVNLEETQQD